MQKSDIWETPPVTKTCALRKKLYKKICKVQGKVVLYELCGRGKTQTSSNCAHTTCHLSKVNLVSLC